MLKSSHKMTPRQVMKLSMSFGVVIGALMYIVCVCVCVFFFFFGRICSVSVGLIVD